MGAGHAGAELAIVVLLLLAEEHVAMIDLAFDRNHVDRADPTFAAASIGHDLVSCCIQHIEHRAIARHDDLLAAAAQPHLDRLGRQTT